MNSRWLQIVVLRVTVASTRRMALAHTTCGVACINCRSTILAATCCTRCHQRNLEIILPVKRKKQTKNRHKAREQKEHKKQPHLFFAYIVDVTGSASHLVDRQQARQVAGESHETGNRRGLQPVFHESK